jgi:hypothetical protein
MLRTKYVDINAVCIMCMCEKVIGATELLFSQECIRSSGSSVSIVSDYGLDDRGSIPDRGGGGPEDFSSSSCVQTGSGAHPASCPMGTWGSFPGGKARSGREADHSPPSSAEVKYEWELYLLSPHVPPWCVAGQLYF